MVRPCLGTGVAGGRKKGKNQKEERKRELGKDKGEGGEGRGEKEKGGKQQKTTIYLHNSTQESPVVYPEVKN